MKMSCNCEKCGSDKVTFEFRDWFGDDPCPPREGYGLWLSCLKCGHSWLDDTNALWEAT